MVGDYLRKVANYWVDDRVSKAWPEVSGDLKLKERLNDAFIAGAQSRHGVEIVEELSTPIKLTTADGAWRFTATGPHDAKAERVGVMQHDDIRAKLQDIGQSVARVETMLAHPIHIVRPNARTAELHVEARKHIFVRGAGSTIAQELSTLAVVRPIERGEPMPDDKECYLFCAGLIRQKPIAEQSEAEIAETFMVNAASVIKECDRLLSVNPRARICVIGSESAFKWSFDGAYAAAKAALHRYVETKRLPSPNQQLVCVAPTCIVNTGMNRQRNSDGVAALEKRRLEHPKQRWLQPIEVARMVHFLLCVDEGYTTNTVIRMNGGEHCR